MEFIISQAEREKLGVVDGKYFHAAISNVGVEEGFRIRVKSKAIADFFCMMSHGTCQSYDFGSQGTALVWDFLPGIQGCDFQTGGDDLYAEAGLNLAWLRRKDLDVGFEIVFPGPWSVEDQTRMKLTLELVAKTIFQRYLRQLQQEFILYTKEV